jgi:hypothetical protein
MGLLSRRNSPIATIETELADLERRRSRLADQLTHIEGELSAAVAARRKQMVETDQDNGVDARGEINNLRDRVAELGEAVGEIDSRILTARGRLDQERDRIARQAESELRTKHLAAVRSALDDFQAAGSRLIDALAAMTAIGPACSAAAIDVKSLVPQLGKAVEVAMVEVENYTATVASGYAAIRIEPKPTEPPAPPKPIARRSMLLLQSSRWPDPEEPGGVRTSGRMTTAMLPLDVASAAASHGFAIDPASEQAFHLRQIESTDYAFNAPGECVDICSPKSAFQPLAQPVTMPAVHSEFIGKARVGTATAARAM